MHSQRTFRAQRPDFWSEMFSSEDYSEKYIWLDERIQFGYLDHKEDPDYLDYGFGYVIKRICDHDNFKNDIGSLVHYIGLRISKGLIALSYRHPEAIIISTKEEFDELVKSRGIEHVLSRYTIYDNRWFAEGG